VISLVGHEGLVDNRMRGIASSASQSAHRTSAARGSDVRLITAPSAARFTHATALEKLTDQPRNRLRDVTRAMKQRGCALRVQAIEEHPRQVRGAGGVGNSKRPLKSRVRPSERWGAYVPIDHSEAVAVELSIFDACDEGVPLLGVEGQVA
jgi:hypothetical protein